MRALRFVIGFVVVALALGLFALFGKPRDPLVALRDHIVSEEVTYQHEIDPGTGKLVYSCSRAATIQGISIKDAAHVLAKGHANRGQKFYVFANSWAKLHTPAPQEKTGSILVNTELSFMQVMWVRMMHIGTNPFGKAIAS